MSDRVDVETGVIEDPIGRDRELEAWLREGVSVSHLAQLVEQDPQGWLLAIGRAYARRAERHARLVAYHRRVEDEIAEAMRPLSDDLTLLRLTVEAELLREREATHGAVKELLVPGIGTWTSRLVPGGFTVEGAAVVEALEGDERARFVRDVPTLDSGEYRKALGGELVAEQESRPRARTAEEAREQVEAAGEAVAARHPGVGWRRSRVSVSAP